MKAKDIYPVDPVMLLPVLLLPLVLFFVMFWYNLSQYEPTPQSYEEYEVCYPDTMIGDGIKQYTLPLPPTISIIELRVESLRQKTEEIEQMLKEHMSKR